MEEKYKDSVFMGINSRHLPDPELCFSLWSKTLKFLTPVVETPLPTKRAHWKLDQVQIQIVNIHCLGRVIFLFGWVQKPNIILKFGIFQKKSPCFEDAKSNLKIGCLATVTATPEEDLNDLVFVIKKCQVDSLHGGFFVPWNPSDHIKKNEVLCKFWIRQSTRTGHFLEGLPNACVNCEYRHAPTKVEGIKVMNLIEHRKQILAREKDKRDCAHGDKQSKAARSRMFVEWILHVYDKEHLQKTGVLDVAGGKGGVAHLLALEGIPVTVIDPRKEKKLNKRMRKQLRKQKANPHEHLESLFEREFIKNNPDLVQSISLIIGMHPDEATHAIVDLSVELGKNFAVVPCKIQQFSIIEGDSTFRLRFSEHVSSLLEERFTGEGLL